MSQITLPTVRLRLVGDDMVIVHKVTGLEIRVPARRFDAFAIRLLRAELMPANSAPKAAA